MNINEKNCRNQNVQAVASSHSLREISPQNHTMTTLYGYHNSHCDIHHQNNCSGHLSLPLSTDCQMNISILAASDALNSNQPTNQLRLTAADMRTHSPSQQLALRTGNHLKAVELGELLQWSYQDESIRNTYHHHHHQIHSNNNSIELHQLQSQLS